MADLFTITEFADYMQQDVNTASATIARRVASGWLLSATRLTAFDAPISDQLFGWALELAAIAFRNPDGATQESIDDFNTSWDKNRRAEILKAAAAFYGGAGSPTYSFPAPDWHWDVVPVADPLTA